MGGKSSGAPPPDPKLITAQIRSMGIQDSAITSMINNSNAMLPLQQESMQFGLDSSRQGQRDMQADRGWMLGRRGQLSGMQDTQIADAKSFNTADRANELAGQASADVNAGFANAEGQQQRSLSRMGVNPNSGRALAVGNQTAIAKAAALAGAATNARTNARVEGRGLTDRAVNALAGYPSMATATGAQGTGFGMAGNGLVNAGAAGMNAGYGAASNAANGMGANATGMFNAQANYQNGQDQIAASNNPLGAIGGAVVHYAMTSDVNQKTAISARKPGQALAQVAAIPVSDWEYKDSSAAADGGQVHTGPMAQDVQRVAGDAAAPDGKAIDLISLNGLNMAATQDLNHKVDALTRQVKYLRVGGIKPGAAHG